MSDLGSGTPEGDPGLSVDFDILFAGLSADALGAPGARQYDAHRVGSTVLLAMASELSGRPSWHDDGSLGMPLSFPWRSKDGRTDFVLQGDSEPGDPESYEEELAAAEEGNPPKGLVIIHGEVKITSSELLIERIVDEEGRDEIFAQAEKALEEEIAVHRFNFETLLEEDDDIEGYGIDPDATVHFLRIAGVLEEINECEATLERITDEDIKQDYAIKKGTRFLYETDGQYESTGAKDNGYVKHQYESYTSIETKDGFVIWRSDPAADEVFLFGQDKFVYGDAELDVLAEVLAEMPVGRPIRDALHLIRANPLTD
jgi:hypothetical protein